MDPSTIPVGESTASYDQPSNTSNAASSAFPVPTWDRYLNARFIGQGAMGKVFLVHDPRLRRDVAIKFVHGNNPDDVRRLIAEARAQARVSHERICKVHEVGEVDGKVYISMQYIAGRQLGTLSDELTTEQKVTLVREAAEGIHEAHRAGVVHRDLKPSNILVERGDDGKLRPYVMDFGLARSTHDDGGTLSGTVIGTPRYMAPEQARGEVGTLDRRADVYSLGATLYYLVAGRAPVAGGAVLDVLHNLLTVDPEPPRALRPDLSPDLEAIILKCLEKDRTQRYDSARSLAEDLGRFLNGEPVLARSAGPWYRLRKRLAKHRRLVIVSAVALVFAVTGLAWGLNASHTATERERLARDFTELVERIEAMARYSVLSPRHDIRGDRAAIRDKMADLEREVQRAGAIASAPGHYALGRAYFTLDEDTRSREHLEAAWRDGFREPRVAYALALVMGKLYQQQLLAAERIEQKHVREARRRELELQYRDPAVRYLAASTGAEAPSADYAAALLAFYGGKLDAALQHIGAIKGLSWFYEAIELQAAILAARARSLRDRGETDAARADFEAARRAYISAAAVGESSVSVYNALGELELSELIMDLYGKGDVRPAFDRGTSATTHALEVMPDHYETLVLQARLRRGMAEHEANHGRNIDELLGASLVDVQRAIGVSPSRAEARLEMARTYRQWAEWRQGRNQDPTAQLRSAIDASEAIPADDRDATYFNNLGLVFKVWADYEDQVGASSQRERAQAIDAYSHALRLDEQLNAAWINLGINYFMRASQAKADALDGDLEAALAALDRGRANNPSHFVPYFYIGNSYALMSERTRARGGDPSPEVRKALAAYEQGVARNQKSPHLYNGQGILRIAQAKDAWSRGLPVDRPLELALDAFERAIAAAPDQAFGYGNAGYAFMLRGSFELRSGEDPGASIQEATRRLQQALEKAPDRAAPLADLGMSYAILGRHQLQHNQDPSKNLDAARLAIRRALAISPKSESIYLYWGETLAVLARLNARRGRPSTGELEAAAQAFQRAIELAPSTREYRIAFARFCADRADIERRTGGDPLPTLKQGLDLMADMLAVHPQSPDDLIVRADLYLGTAHSVRDRDQRRRLGQQAVDDLSLALTTSPRLARISEPRLAVARRIAFE